MPAISRLARLDDAAAICALFRARIPAWQRLDENGQVQDVPYDSLSLYERWLHGGAWMSLETSAIYLNHLLLGAGFPLVVTDQQDRVVGYIEAYLSGEGDPFGTNMNIAHLIAADETAKNALLDGVAHQAAHLKAAQLTIATPGDVELPAGIRTAHVAGLRRYSLTAREGQVFYKVTDLTNFDPLQIHGWSMPVGRATSARHQWETLMPRLFETMPEIAARKRARLRVTAGGQEAIIYCEVRLHDPRSADVAIWTPKIVQTQVITALRDWARREGYRTLWLLANENAVNALGADAEPDGFEVQIHGLAV